MVSEYAWRRNSRRRGLFCWHSVIRVQLSFVPLGTPRPPCGGAVRLLFVNKSWEGISMKVSSRFASHMAGFLSLAMLATGATAQAPPKQKPSSEEDIRAALFGGVPGDRWKEGLLFEGIKPHPWLKSAANWFPRSENVQPNEMRIMFMGTAPFIRPGQMNTSILVELGNGDKFIFDMGEGSVSNYIAAGFALI